MTREAATAGGREDEREPTARSGAPARRRGRAVLAAARSREPAAGPPERSLLAVRRARLRGADHRRPRSTSRRRRAPASSAPIRRRTACRLPSSRSPTRSRASTAGCQRRPGRLRLLPQPLPRGRSANPRLRDRCRGRDPRLRPLRQAARDLVLVHTGWRLPAHPGRLRRGRPRAARTTVNFLSDQRPRRSAATVAGSSATAAGASRSASTATAPSRTSTGSASARRSSSPIRAGSSTDEIRGGNYTTAEIRPTRRRAARGVPRALAESRGALRWPVRAAADERDGSPRRGVVASGLVDEFPGLYLRWLEVPPRLRPQPAVAEAPAGGALGSVRRTAGDRFPDEADPLGLPGLLPPYRPRPRRAADAGGGGGARADAQGRLRQPQPARRRADDRDDRVRRPGDAFDAAVARRAAWRSARAIAGEVARGAARRAPRGHAGDRRRPRPVALLFGAVASGRGVTPGHRAHDPARVGVAGVPEIAVEEALCGSPRRSSPRLS